MFKRKVTSIILTIALCFTVLIPASIDNVYASSFVPTNLKCTVTEKNNIKLSWNGLDECDAEDLDDYYYEVQVKKPGASSYKFLDKVCLSSDGWDTYTTYVTPDKYGDYSFRVRVYFMFPECEDDVEAGDWWDEEEEEEDYDFYSVKSAEVKDLSEWKYTTCTVLGKVTLKAANKGSQKIKLTWNKSQGANGYKIYRSKSKNGKYKMVKKCTSGATTSWTDTTVSKNTKYFYYIVPTSKSGKTGKASAKVQCQAGVAKPTIKNVKLNTTSITVSWKKVANANGYEVYRATSKSGKYKKIKTIKSGNTLSYKDKHPVQGKTNYYKIKAYKTIDGKKCESSFSNIKSKKYTKNVYIGHPDYSFYDADYGEIVMQIKKVEYKNNEVVLTALVQNNRIFYADYFDWVRITLTDDSGKTIARQKFHDRSIKLDGYDYKTMTFTFDTGTKNISNLRDGVSMEYQYYYWYNY